MCTNCRARSSTLSIRSIHLPIISQNYLIGGRSVDLAGQGSALQAVRQFRGIRVVYGLAFFYCKESRVLQKERQQNSSQYAVDVLLCCKCASIDDQRHPNVKRNCIPDYNF
ncbi:hypothetical protein TNCV_4102161 [Trichonephila clavipes]|nr:hypothetical protein TNCV_4102161 [Trichonephila clavipes]